MHLRRRVMRRACNLNRDPRENRSDPFAGAITAEVLIEFNLDAQSKIDGESSRGKERERKRPMKAPRIRLATSVIAQLLDNSAINMLISGGNFFARAFIPAAKTNSTVARVTKARRRRWRQSTGFPRQIITVGTKERAPGPYGRFKRAITRKLRRLD
ncbi:hypothetical protein PUN28_000445 [Cardiocondyla obscurior]|uniref:Ribosomal protein L14 n=1 Tax=Cardiocondyla obscurior TaxID=286306 RepID=A0AAW2GZZ0_9HYME